MTKCGGIIPKSRKADAIRGAFFGMLEITSFLRQRGLAKKTELVRYDEDSWL